MSKRCGVYLTRDGECRERCPSIDTKFVLIRIRCESGKEETIGAYLCEEHLP